MPLYSYRREDGTTFDIKQSFHEDPLTIDPQTGQRVVRIVQQAGVIFKGSGFYINDSKSKSSTTLTNGSKTNNSEGAKTTDSPAKTEATPAAVKTEAAAD